MDSATQASKQREQQIAQAEELLSGRRDKAGFAAGLYFGEYLAERLVTYPDLAADAQANALVEQVRDFCRDHIDAAEIDREADIPRSVIDGLGQLGVLGACLPESAGGLGLSQTAYCRILEVLGAHCGSTALLVNAHHSIGPRALVLFGSQEQQQQWLPKQASGEWISAFALTETEAGSDAGNVQTTATLSDDGQHYVINGDKRYITNGALARLVLVMARTQMEDGNSKITAFQVDSQTQGFEIVEPRMAKMGVRGTATAKLRFTNMVVPRENIVGPIGGGLKVALTVLDYGRTTFGATCTGTAKYCCERAAAHANRRVQFGQKLAEFELVKEKIAWMYAYAYAMEACTYQTAALIDAGEDDYMLETAMLKVFNTEALWRILGDTFQIHGGMAYFNDEPFERMIRDARINSIGEGSNDVLRSFIALVGMRDVGNYLQGLLSAVGRPLSNAGLLATAVGDRLERLFANPSVRVHSTGLQSEAARVGRLVGRFGKSVERLLRVYQESILERQYQLSRVSEAAMHLYACGCVLSRLDAQLAKPVGDDKAQADSLAAGRHFLMLAERQIEQSLVAMKNHDDEATTAFADRMLKR